MEEFDHLKIQLEDIILATHNFGPNKLIGRGGFGTVYKGELSRPDGIITVACKRLDRQFGQGNVEFLKEIMMLSKYKHANLVSLLYFCIEGDERILVYEYAPHGSLDCHLSDPTLTWIRRLKICIGVAQALDYLHDPADTYQRILHRDIKSSNILLDEQWNPKVSDFGLSKFGPANQPQTFLVTNAVGTPGYCDPLYWETGVLSKESDVYSFGVVLFEVMCGTLCCEYRDGRLHGILASTWKKCFKEKRLDHIINHGLERHMEPGSLNTFSTIAYQCLKTNRKERPTMAKIVEELKVALEQQEVFEDMGKKLNFEGMRRIADLLVSPLAYKTQSQLLLLFMKGLLIDNGKTWFSINNKGQHCEAIAVEKCISLDEKRLFTRGENLDSRFQYLLEYKSTQDLRLRVETQFLSLHVTYVINLVYKCQFPPQGCLRIPFRYKLAEMKAYATSCVAHEGERGWLRTELFQFTSTKNQHHFDIQFTSEMRSKEDHVLSYLFYIFIEAVEFRPVDFEENENKVVMQPTDVDNDWRERVPNDYNKIVEDVDKSMTTKEVYALLRRGIYINKSQQWFSISKKSEKRLMLPARAFLPKRKFHLSQRKTWLWKSLPGSRFMEVAECSDNNRLAISLQIDSYLLSSGIKYACYLVFKLPENASVFEGIVITNFTEWVGGNCIYLVTPPHTPVIVLSPDERPSGSRKIKGHPKLRKDGWMEVQVWQFYHLSGRVSFTMDGYLESLKGWNFTGLLVQGFEFRPAKVFSLNYFEGMYM